MITKGTQSLGGVTLHEAEVLLWSHVLTHKDHKSMRAQNQINMIWRYAKPVLIILYACVMIRLLVATNLGNLLDIVKTELPIYLALSLGLWVFMKTGVYQTIKKQAERPVFRNAVITNQRIVLFNQDIDADDKFIRQEFKPSDIADAVLDYENGGRALSIRPRKDGKNSILIGMADFEEALGVIKAQFLMAAKP